MNLGLISFLLESLWWGFWLVVVACIVGPWLWERRPFQRPPPTLEELQAADRRTAEGVRLAEFEAEVQAEGVDIWRPDPELTKAASRDAPLP